MNNWIESSLNQSINIYVVDDNDKHIYKIIEVLNNSKQKFFNLKKRSEHTSLIKTELSKLGHELCFKVYSNRVLPNDEKIIKEQPVNPNCKKKENSFLNKEWLYDLHWYTESENISYMPETLPLVMEVEWENIRNEDKNKEWYSAMKFDFQKLVVSNAELRLMIFFLMKKDKEKYLVELYNYFYKVINTSYRHLADNAKFLFVAYDNQINDFRFCVIQKIVQNRISI